MDGPFTETKEVVAGFWLWEVSSIEAAVEWVKKCPNPMPKDSDIDIRPLFSLEDIERWRERKIRLDLLGTAFLFRYYLRPLPEWVVP